MEYHNTAVIGSLYDFPFHIERPYGVYIIPARPKDDLVTIDPDYWKTYGTLLVQDAVEGMDIGEKRRIQMREYGPAIALDLVKSEDLVKFGVFVADGKVPTPEELQLAWARLIAHYRYLIQDGDNKYSKPETRREISDLHRRAVTHLREKREWVYSFRDVTPTPICPFCGETQRIHDAAICWNCKQIINVDRATELGMIPPVPVTVGAEPNVVRGPGGKFQRKD